MLEQRIAEALLTGVGRDIALDILQDGNPSHSMIGDCVLRVPPRLQRKFHFIDCPVQKLYGCEKLNLEKVQATPYVNYTDFYGSCALAVAYMACALLGNDCRGVFGLTEMPFLLGRLQRTEVKVGPLEVPDLCALLSCQDVGLHAYHQRPADPQCLWDVPGYASEVMLALALHSYILSGMPVILGCDMYRLHGWGFDFFSRDADSLYAAEAFPGLYHCEPNQNSGFRVMEPQSLECMPHFLLVIGAARDSTSFVIHDPYGMPYLTADAHALVKSALYRDTKCENLEAAHFVGVTPPGVRIPFFRGIGGVGSEDSLGIYDLAMEAGPLVVRPNAERLCCQKIASSIFRLIQHCDLSSQRSRCALEGVVPSKLQPDFSARLAKVAIRGTSDWVWTVFLDDCCLVFDAGKRAPVRDYYSAGGELGSDAMRRDFLLGVIELGELSSAVASPSNPTSCRSQSSHHNERPRGVPLRKSLISSFCVTGLFSDDVPLESDPLDVYFERDDLAMELYAFLQRDLAALMGSAANLIGTANPYCQQWSVVRNLAKLADCKDPWIRALAQAIDRKLTRDGKRIDICGLATFIPDATSSDSGRRHRARAAMSVISSLAVELQRLEHPVAFIEIVAGSRVAQIQRQRSEAHLTHLLVKTDPLEQTQSYLDDFLQGMSAETGFTRVYSLELEPGASFAFNSMDVLKRAVEFCEMMAQRGIMLGYNFDVCHWMLSGAVPGQVSSEIVSRITHCHICDTFRGHMDDSPLCSIRESGELTQWLDLIQQKINMPQPPVPYSGYISVEIECAKHLDDVRSSIEALGRLIGAGNH